MRGTIAALLIAGALAVVLMVAGCSGAGVAAGDVRGDAVRATAEDHLSAVTLLKGWLKILHERAAAAAAVGVHTCQQCEPICDMEFFEDGSYRMWGTNSDCSVFDYTVQVDESGTGTITWPTGDVMSQWWGPPIWDGDRLSQDVADTFPDGTELRYTATVDFALPESPQRWEGTATLPDGREMEFALDRAIEGDDHLILELPDGSQLETTIPTTPVPGTVFWPVFEEGGTGHYVSAAGQRLDFTITGQDDQWDRWVFTGADDTHGDFAIDQQFAGVGEMTQNGDVLGAFRWTDTGAGALDLVGTTSWAVAPSATARDFQVDQWVANIAVLNPMPMY